MSSAIVHYIKLCSAWETFRQVADRLVHYTVQGKLFKTVQKCWVGNLYLEVFTYNRRVGDWVDFGWIIEVDINVATPSSLKVILKGTARYAGQLLAAAKGYGWVMVVFLLLKSNTAV